MRTLFIIFGCLVLVACSDKPVTKNPQEIARTPADSKPVATVAAANAEGLQLLLIPERPGINSNLQVQVAGCTERLNYSWEINGTPVEAVTVAQFPAGQYRHGDIVTVNVKCGSRVISSAVTIESTPPVVNQISLKNPTVTAGEEIEVVVEATDSDGDDIDFRYIWTINDAEQGFVSGPVLPAASVRTGDSISVTVIPSDRYGEGRSLQSIIFVVPNSPPRFVSKPPVTFRAVEYRYNAQAIDPDGNKLTYRLESAPIGMQVDSASGVIFWPIPAGAKGDFAVKIIAVDPGGQQAFQEFTITLSAEEKCP